MIFFDTHLSPPRLARGPRSTTSAFALPLTQNHQSSDLAGVSSGLDLSFLGDLQDGIYSRFPRLAGLQKSTLMAVGVDYQDRTYILQENDEVSFFPPVQGG